MPSENNELIDAMTTTDLATMMVEQARADPEVFVALMLAEGVPGHPLAPVHRRLQRHLSGHPRALVELPRDHGKTTQVCLRVLWELGREPNLRVKIVCASETIAADRTRYLRMQIEASPLLRQVFPHLNRGYPWTAPAFSVARSPRILGPSVAAFGIGAARTGSFGEYDDLLDAAATGAMRMLNVRSPRVWDWG